MLATLAVVWRTVTRRLFADWLIVGAVFVSVVLAAALLSAGPIYADAVTISALQRSIDNAPTADATSSVGIKVFADDYDVVDRATRARLADALATTGGVVYSHVEADSYGIEGRQAEDERTELVSLQYFEDIETHAVLLEGTWPAPRDEPHEIAIPQATAAGLEVDVGDVIEIANRLDPSITSSVQVTGVFAPNDPTDSFWVDDPMIAPGIVETANFRTFGPLVMPFQTMLEHFTPVRVNAGWRAFPDFSALTVDQVGALRAAMTGLPVILDVTLRETLGTGVSATSGFTVESGLPDLLAGLDRSLTVTRSSVLALLVQLAILAGYSLILTAGLLVDTRRTETVLMRSRGTSPRQILLVATLEGIVLTVPAALAAPFLASWLLGILNEVGPLAAIDLTIDPVVTPGSFVLAFVAAMLAMVVLAYPAYRSARAFGTPSTSRRRQESEPVSQRIGLDVALIALTVIAFWQLTVVGPQVSARVRGRFGVDPLLIAAPTLGLLAGAVLALRVIPLLARTAEWVSARGKARVAALAAWQVARRPRRYTRSSLLLIMAVGIGFLAASYSTTWIDSQRDQAAFEIGADIAVTPAGGRDVVDAMHLRTAHESISGVGESMPVWAMLGQLAGGGGTGQFVALDAAIAAETVAIRDDISPDFAGLMAAMVEGRPGLPSIEIDGEPDTLVLSLEATELIPTGDEFESCDISDDELDEQERAADVCFDGDLRLIIKDGDDLLHRIDAGAIPVNDGVALLQGDLTGVTPTGRSIDPTYPLSLVGFEIAMQLPQGTSRSVTLAILGVDAVDSGERSGVQVEDDDAGWVVESVPIGRTERPPAIAVRSETPLTLEIETGSSAAENLTYLGLRPAGASLPETFPIVVSETFIESNVTALDDTVRLPSLRIRNDDARVIGTIEGFPTTDADLGEVVLLDLATYQAMGYRAGANIPRPASYWLTIDGDPSPVVDELRSPPINSFAVAGQQELVDNLTADPVALATIGALAIGFVAAAVFATVGFAVSATVSARERLVEFALVRALGLSRRQLAAWLSLEQGVLVVLSLLLGTLVGVLLTAVVLPLITLTQGGQPAVPPVLVRYPWTVILALEIGVVAVLAAVVTAMTVLLRRIGLGSLLRMGED